MRIPGPTISDIVEFPTISEFPTESPTHKEDLKSIAALPRTERIFTELMTNDCKLKASREGSK